jgi:hypothetical protein
MLAPKEKTHEGENADEPNESKQIYKPACSFDFTLSDCDHHIGKIIDVAWLSLDVSSTLIPSETTSHVRPFNLRRIRVIILLHRQTHLFQYIVRVAEFLAIDADIVDTLQLITLLL